MGRRQIRFFSCICLLLTIFFSPLIPKVHAPNRYVLDFNGEDSYVEVSDSSSLNITGEEVSIEAWVNLNTMNGSVTPFPYVMVKGTLGIDPWFGYGLFIDARTDPPKIHFGCNLDGTWRSDTGSEVSLGVWHHLVATYNGASFGLYIDGVADSFDHTGTLTLNDKDIHIGGESGEADRWLNGTIDEVRIYNRSLSSVEITFSYGSERGVDISLNQTGLVAWWKFNTGSGTTAYDETANNNDGTIYGASWVQGGVVFPQTAGEILEDAAVVGAQFFSVTLVLAVIYVIGATKLTYEEKILFVLASVLILILILIFASMPMMDVGR